MPRRCGPTSRLCPPGGGRRLVTGAQLVRRNEELAALYEKIKIQKSTLAKGEAQFEERVREIAQLRRRVAELRQELEESKAQVANVGDLRNEVFRLEREVLQEKTKIKALSEELERPLNVHRWRKLAGSDPKRYDLIRKIQVLQKRLIKKTEEVRAHRRRGALWRVRSAHWAASARRRRRRTC